MKIRLVVRQLGLLLIVLSAVLALMAIVFYLVQSWLDHHVDLAAESGLLITSAIGFISGGLMWRFTRGRNDLLGRREAMLLVAMSWFIGAAFCGIPYFAWALLSDQIVSDHPFFNPVNCYFESMSGLTTTGATVITEIEALPKSILLWRSLTHWLGGLGIVVLFVAVLPSLGVVGKRLVSVEATGPSYEGVRPSIRETARVLWLIYVGLTIAQTSALWLAGMTFFDALCHTFATVATGGFSTRNASVAAYDSLAVEVIITVFMFLAGVNFALYYHAFHQRFSRIWKDLELRAYLIIVGVASAVITVGLLHEPIITSSGAVQAASVGSAVRHGVFQAVAIQTTTGFVTADFDHWAFVPKATLVALMFIGASAGSTGGGIKVIRVWMALRIMFHEIEHVFRPHVVRPLKLGSRAIDASLKLNVLGYVLGILLLFLIGAVALMLLEPAGQINFTTAATASAATLNNIGPGLAEVGAIRNFGWFTNSSKIVMCVLMALGRLEIFAVIVLFMPRFWQRL